MRIISGSHKGRPIQTISGNNTRPTTDKVREAIFNALGQYFDGGMSLDLFAGSGALSFEGISRGIEHAVLIDNFPLAIKNLYKNAESLQMQEQVEIYRNDAMRALKRLAKDERQFAMIYIDPPYKNDWIDTILAIIKDNNLLTDDGLILLETGSETKYKDNPNGYLCEYDRQYGETRIQILKKMETSV
ncbi:16S rRNA (guanine(966)-N(2))-methyltransferase RsmD [Culicoidibacter larvae]|uniref:16S rRNA (Guanine(966)-N(2))-methyltransferase RsmD n=1 Tax=Culicoidibacter larvae TaxID=2579976 RepID=A0A5R8QAC0_9FIRM|nr:16S rRNA (guanine(966)-N(2))-methyltransferase RsmD [Culicoidibacter larvae]TLG72541.1 16S rRNA (guanine(966)-N(2))-methyltransferase RsmD [Culicoidibacter larvae]